MINIKKIKVIVVIIEEYSHVLYIQMMKNLTQINDLLHILLAA